jgi:O-antigen/teichoic acid export membrane protein
MSPFRNILKLSAGDFVAKVAYFLAFVYLAQKLGTDGYGVLEFALAVRTYLVLLADAGLELWAIREAAKGLDVRVLASRVIPARLLLAGVALAATGLFTLLPGNPHLRLLLPLLTLTVLVQAFNLKWVFMGQERMARVAIGLIASQLAFAGCVILLVHQPADLLRVAIAFLTSEFLITVYFWLLFAKLHGALKVVADWTGIRSVMRPVLTLGAAQCLSLMSYNVDSILIGVMLGPGAVGLYAAAYKPITAVLTAPVTYLQGLFPSFARSFKEDQAQFRAMVLRSLRFTATFAIPIGVGGTLLAAPVINLLFGPSYAASVPVLQLLSWSAVLVTLRGNFRHTLNAAGRQHLDLTCAGSAAVLNVVLNLLLIPRYGIEGAAAATLASEAFWFLLARYLFTRHVMALPLLPAMWRPLIAGLGMAALLIWGGAMPWLIRAAAAGGVYGAILLLLGEPDLKLALAGTKSAWGLAQGEDVRAAVEKRKR